MKSAYRAFYLSLFIWFLRKVLDWKEMQFKIACREFESRVDKFMEDFRKTCKDPFMAPFIPFSPPEGYREPEVEEPEEPYGGDSM